MRRRDYLTCVGAVGIGGAAAAGRQQSSIERLGSADGVTVTPGTTVLFEAAVPDGVDHADVEWDLGGLSGGPLIDLSYATGDAARTARFEDRGSHTIRASHDGTTVEWDVTVAEGGRGPPTVESIATTPGPDEPVGVDDSIAVTATAADADGDLDRLVWVEGRNYTVVEIQAIEGEGATTTLSLDETPHWINFGYPTVAYPVCADGRVGDGVTSDGPTVRQPFELEIAGTNAPVTAGERFTATVTVENVGDMMMVGPNTQDVRLVVGDEVVERESVTLEWAETTTIELGYDTYPVERDVTFPIRVECADDAATREIEVTSADSNGSDDSDGSDGDPDRGTLTVSIRGTNAPVTGGQRLSVDATVSATGSGSASGPVELVVGGEVVDTCRADLAAGDSTRTTLGYETYPVERGVTVTLVVRTPTDAASTSVPVDGTE